MVTRSHLPVRNTLTRPGPPDNGRLGADEYEVKWLTFARNKLLRWRYHESTLTKQGVIAFYDHNYNRPTDNYAAFMSVPLGLSDDEVRLLADNTMALINIKENLL